MPYVTIKLPPMYRQMSLEEFLFETDTKPTIINENETNTRTYFVEKVPDKIRRQYDFDKMAHQIIDFFHSTWELRRKPREELYHTFYIPKRSGGLRRIDAPNPELMDALRQFKTILETDFKAMYHTAAFAYIKNRSTLDAVKRHQANESKWFAKFDLSNLFGSTTLDFVMKMFSMIYPFSKFFENDHYAGEFKDCLELAFLNGGLPQGTPVSPLITNIMMIPIDYELANGFRDFHKQRYIYTRYADDYTISSRYDFDYRQVEWYIQSTLRKYDAPFQINESKTKYGSSAGKNYILGCLLTKDNEITIGSKKKKQFHAMLASYVMDKKNGIEWNKEDVQVMEGYRNYYRMVEREKIDNMVKSIGDKFNVDIPMLIKEDLRK